MPELPSEHCSELAGVPGSDMFACLVWDGNPTLFAAPRQIEIYRGKNLLRTLDPGGPIFEWHWWNHDQQISIHYGVPGSYTLFDVITGRKLETAVPKAASTELPEWAKSASERSDEAVPKGAVYSQQRTQWIAKLLRAIQALHPGIRRKDLAPLLTTEGGLSTREQSTYVSSECPYIKVDIRFKPSAKDPGISSEGPEDIVEFISRPYLAWSISD